MCAHRYDPGQNPSCGGCPVNNDCAMVCCPNCGHSTIDPSQSKLARIASWLFGLGKTPTKTVPAPPGSIPLSEVTFSHWGWQTIPVAEPTPNGNGSSSKNWQTLAQIQPGERARVLAFSPWLPQNRKAHLQAYGVVPGYWVSVLQQNPVTVVQVEHTELALENELAEGIRVEREQQSADLVCQNQAFTFTRKNCLNQNCQN